MQKTFITKTILVIFLLSACVAKADVKKEPFVADTAVPTSTIATTVEINNEESDTYFKNNEIYFWIDPATVNRNTISFIEEMLNNSSGWGSKTDIKFVYTAEKNKTHISVYMQNSWADVERACANNKDAAGCSSPYVTIGGEYACWINLRAAYDGLPIEGFLSILNHEMGHCLGVRHSKIKGDLMYESMNYTTLKEIVYPTDIDIKQAKEYLKYLEEKTKALR